jgi:hypothetical protein
MLSWFPGWGAKFVEFHTSRNCPKRVERACSVALQTTQGPISSSVYRPNSRSERCSYPFSDSFSRHSGE